MHYWEGLASNRGSIEKSWYWRSKSRFFDYVQPAILLPLYSQPLRWPGAFLTSPPDWEGVGIPMSWYTSKTAWSALIKVLVGRVNEDNGNVCKSLATLVNELIMTASCYKSGKSMTTAACYKSKVDVHLAIRVVSWWWQVYKITCQIKCWITWS